MGQYLHHYSDFDDLRINYINSGPETVYTVTPQTITVTGATIMVWDYQNNQEVVCGTTNNYNGTYSQVDVDGNNSELRALYSDGTNTATAYFGVDENSESSDFVYRGMALLIDGQAEYYQFNSAEELQAKAVTKFPEYCEPWVSYTEKKPIITLENGKTYKYVGLQTGWCPGGLFL